MASYLEYVDQLHQLIAKDQLSTVLNELQALLKGSPAFDEAVLQSARYQGLMKDIRTGKLDVQTAELRRNHLRYALIDMVRELEEQLPELPTLQEEVAQYLKERPVHNEAHITGDGNINVQGVSGSSVNIQQNEADPNLAAAGHEMAHQNESGTTPRENTTEPPPLPESGSEVDLIRLQVSGARGSKSADGSWNANGSIVSERDFLVLEGVLGGCFQALADHPVRGARTLSPRVTLRVENGQIVELAALDPDVTAVPMPDGSTDPLSRDFEACLREHLPGAELEVSGTFTTVWKVPAVHVYLEELRQREAFAAMPDVHREAHLVKERRIVAEGILRVVAGDVSECTGREQVEVRLKADKSGHATLSAEEKLPREARKCLQKLGEQLQVPPAGRGLNRRFVVEGSSGAVDVAEF